MNVIRHGNLRGNVSSGNKKPLLSSSAKPRGKGRGALDFDPILYRPGQKVVTSSSSSGGMRSPSNLQLNVALNSTASQKYSSSTENKSISNTGLSSHLMGHCLLKNEKTSRTVTSFSSGKSNSLFTPTPKFPWGGSLNTPSSSHITPKNTISSSTPRTTPTSSATSRDQHPSHVVIAITEGRGHARCEVGMAVMDIKRPRLILCQLSDRQTYVNTLTKVNVFHPVEILIPHTFVDCNPPNKLYSLLEEKFPHVRMTKVQRRLFRDSEGLAKVQSLCLPENSSCQLILKERFYALAAAAALFKYVEFVQNVIFAAQSLKVEYQGAHHGTIIDVKTAKDLELLLNQQSNSSKHSLVGILDKCCTHGGSRLLRASLLNPLCSQPSIKFRQDAVQELVEKPEMGQKLREVLKQISDVEQLLTLCMQSPSSIDSMQAMETRVNYVLMLKATMESLPLLVTALENSQSFIFCKASKCFQDPRGGLIKDRILETLNEDVKAVKGKTANFQRCFAIKSGVNDLLDVARKTYCELINDMHDSVNDLESTHSLPLKMNYSVTKGYHIQIPVPRNKPIKVSDLPAVFVQAVASGRNNITCTTAALLHANERIKQITSEILSLSNKFFAVILNDIRQHISFLYEMCDSIAEVDLIFALALISSCDNYVRPQFGDALSLKASRHPILESIASCIPTSNSVEATSWQNLTIITGPNMSGKSIYLKQILLLQIMAQIGSYVPAGEASFRITDRIFSHLNFDDSIENNASTLSLEMREMQLILSSLTATSLVALDELCRGTSVEEGTAIAWALLQELSQSTAFVFVTTHFKDLTTLASLYPCIKNVHLETVEHECSDKKNRLIYTHRLLPGLNPVQNYGIRLAEEMGTPEAVIETAKRISLQVKNVSETNLGSTSGDEGYVRALYFHKLKALALNRDEFTKENLLKIQSEFKEKLKIAQEMSEAVKIQTQKVQVDTSLNGETKKKTSPNNNSKCDILRDSDFHVQNKSQQKLCDYSSSSLSYNIPSLQQFSTPQNSTPKSAACNLADYSTNSGFSPREDIESIEPGTLTLDGSRASPLFNTSSSDLTLSPGSLKSPNSQATWPRNLSVIDESLDYEASVSKDYLFDSEKTPKSNILRDGFVMSNSSPSSHTTSDSQRSPFVFNPSQTSTNSVKIDILHPNQGNENFCFQPTSFNMTETCLDLSPEIRSSTSTPKSSARGRSLSSLFKTPEGTSFSTPIMKSLKSSSDRLKEYKKRKYDRIFKKSPLDETPSPVFDTESCKSPSSKNMRYMVEPEVKEKMLCPSPNVGSQMLCKSLQMLMEAYKSSDSDSDD